MSKRKADVNDIIFEIDSEDIDSSSEEEKKAPKRRTVILNNKVKKRNKSKENEDKYIDIVNVDSSGDEVTELQIEPNVTNGGKTFPVAIEEETSQLSLQHQNNIENINIDLTEKSDDVRNENFEEDIIVDSPSSTGSINIVAGCENRAPLITIKFRDKHLAKDYKKKIKEFMLNLIKLHDEEHLTGSETETDLELDIWPEDIDDDVDVDVENDRLMGDEKTVEDNLFFEDIAPKETVNHEVPQYSQNTMVLSNVPDEECTAPPIFRRGPICFNCDGLHQLRDCTLPKNQIKIAEKRKAMAMSKVGRYHVEDDQKYGHLTPGRISGPLRHALDLKRDDLPFFIYRMRILGYPPGWLEEARISHSGITMFDSLGKAILDPEEEEGEVCEPGSKDKYDIKKIIDFPGFNVPPSSRYKERGDLYGFPPMSEQDSKMNMLQVLAPNAMKAYKRKKLTFFPTASLNNSIGGQGEMELDDTDDVQDFPSLPPLPDEAPPPVPPPPPPPDDTPQPAAETQPEVTESECENKSESGDRSDDKPCEDDNMKIASEEGDIKNDEPAVVVADEKSQLIKGRESPSLVDLENKKKLLLAALEGGSSGVKSQEKAPTDTTSPSNDIQEKPLESNSDIQNSPSEKPSKGHVKSTSFGTPVLNIASSYATLPSDDKFAKDICDIINFENLPDSTGKYAKICSLLKRVKSEVDRIQDS